jgi:hypothetical protein
MLAGGRSLWRTNDAKAPITDAVGPSWQAIKPPSGSAINAIAVMPGNADLVWVCYNRDGEVAVSDNATKAKPDWTMLRAPNFERSKRRCNTVAVDANNPGRAYVGFGGFEAHGLWRIDKRGTTWADAEWVDLSRELVRAPVRTVTIHPTHPDWIYVGTDVGLTVSDNDGRSWCESSEGPVNTAVTHLSWNKYGNLDATLLAATYGRGLFEIRVEGR